MQPRDPVYAVFLQAAKDLLDSIERTPKAWEDLSPSQRRTRERQIWVLLDAMRAPRELFNQKQKLTAADVMHCNLADLRPLRDIIYIPSDRSIGRLRNAIAEAQATLTADCKFEHDGEQTKKPVGVKHR